jgi:hypothetical protein
MAKKLSIGTWAYFRYRRQKGGGDDGLGLVLRWGRLAFLVMA